MPRKRSMLHVRQHLENVAQMCEHLQELKPDQPVPPSLRTWIIQNKLVTKAILRKHAVTPTNRKDIYIERN